LGIAFTKNNSRNEWLLEKAMEMGIEQIYPIITDRTEKDKLKMERLQGILISAMLQSQQCYLPQLHDSIKLKALLQQSTTTAQRFIAHCIDTEERKSYITHLQPGKDTLMLIGPEGDFTPAEINLCLEAGLEPVSLGQNRLRTETAGLYACTIFNAVNYG
jgi:16S rRNA (uracil1498-N3)-methyltransferase